MTIRRITRDRYLTPEEGAHYAAIRKRFEEELPELIEHFHAEYAGRTEANGVASEFRTSRESHALSVSAAAAAAGCDPAEAEAIENGTGNPTLETLRNYARAVGKRLVIRLADPEEPAGAVATPGVSG